MPGKSRFPGPSGHLASWSIRREAGVGQQSHFQEVGIRNTRQSIAESYMDGGSGENSNPVRGLEPSEELQQIFRSVVAKGEKGRRGKDWEYGLGSCKLCTLLCIGWISNKVLLYSTGNYIQYPVINHNGKGYF